MLKHLTDADIRNLLRAEVARAGSQVAYAKRVGVSAQYINDLVAMRPQRPITPLVAGWLGLVKGHHWTPAPERLKINETPIDKVP